MDRPPRQDSNSQNSWLEAAQAEVGDLKTSPEAPQTPSADASNAPPFNGHELCERLIAQIATNHHQLMEATKRNAFLTRWTPVCQSDKRLESESGADRVGREILGSLGEKFDRYLDRAENSSEESLSKGSEIGIGIETGVVGAANMRDPHPYAARISDEHPLVVRAVTAGSPADKAGIQPGDRLMAIGGMDVNGKKRSEITDLYSSTSGVPVELTVSSQATGEKRNVIVTPAETNEPVVSYRPIGDGVGYVRLRNFVDQNVASQMVMALGQASHDQAVVLDLRNNGGGKFQYMRHVAETMLPSGKLYRLERREGDQAETEDRSLTETTEVTDTAEGGKHDIIEVSRIFGRVLPKGMPLVVLVDEYTGSVSEVLTGLLKSNEVAVVVGQPTTGKTVGQMECDLPYGRMAALTNFEYFPGGKPAYDTGIIPDVLVADGRIAGRDPQLDRAKQEAIRLAALTDSR